MRTGLRPDEGCRDKVTIFMQRPFELSLVADGSPVRCRGEGPYSTSRCRDKAVCVVAEPKTSIGDPTLKEIVRLGIVSEEVMRRAVHTENDEERSLEAVLDRLLQDKSISRFQLRAIQDNRTRSLVFDQFILLNRQKHSGSGIVYTARHREMDRPVLLKVLPPELAADAELLLRFRREVKLSGTLKHPNLITAFSAGQYEGLHYLTTEFFDGVSVERVITKRGAFGVPLTLSVLQQVLQGLIDLHQNGIVHRNVTPASILIDRGRKVKLGDCGLAMILDDELKATGSNASGRLTTPGIIVGAVDFMAPEQCHGGETIDQRADLYSIGATMYFMLTGKKMYPDRPVMEVIISHRDESPPSLAEIAPQLDPLFQRLVAKDPSGRPEDAAEVLLAIRMLKSQAGGAAESGSGSKSHSSDRPVKAKRPTNQSGTMTMVVDVDALRSTYQSGVEEFLPVDAAAAAAAPITVDLPTAKSSGTNPDAPPPSASGVATPERRSGDSATVIESQLGSVEPALVASLVTDSDPGTDPSSTSSPTGSVPDFLVTASSGAGSAAQRLMWGTMAALGVTVAGLFTFADPIDWVRTQLSGGRTRVTIEVEGAVPGTVVMLDDRELTEEELGAAIAVDPGEHTVSARGTHVRRVRTNFRISENEQKKFVLQLSPRTATKSSATSSGHLEGQFQTRPSLE